MGKYLIRLLFNIFLLAMVFVAASCRGGGGGNRSSLPVTGDPLNNWHLRNSLPQSNTLSGAAYGNGIFAAVGNYTSPVGYFGMVLTSSDGITWTAGPSVIIPPFYGVTYGNGTFVAIGLWDNPDIPLTA